MRAYKSFEFHWNIDNSFFERRVIPVKNMDVKSHVIL